MAKVSVIIPVYNSQEFICETIDSVLAQSYKDYEIIVVDDGSTDQSREILQQYGSRIKYIYQDNKGVCSAVNRGILESKGQYIALLGSDDIWFEDKLKVQVEIAGQHPEVDLFFTDTEAFTSKGLYKSSYKPTNLKNDPASMRYKLARLKVNDGTIIIGNFYRDLLLGNIFTASTSLIRTSCLQEVGCCDEDLEIEDYDLWIRIARHRLILYCNQVTTRYRLRDDSISGPLNFRIFFYKSYEARVLQKQLDSCSKSLKRLIHRNIQECYKTAIWAYFNVGELKRVRHLSLRSLAFNIFQLKIFLYLVASFFPAGFIKPRTLLVTTPQKPKPPSS